MTVRSSRRPPLDTARRAAIGATIGAAPRATTGAVRRAAIGAAIIGLTLLGAAPASADPTRMVAAPGGWRSDAEQATALAQRFAAATHFGGRTTVTAAEAYVADKPGVALFVTRATATLSAPSAPSAPAAPLAPSGGSAPPGATDADPLARLARGALDEVRAGSRRATLSGGSAEENAWQEHVEAAARQVTATLTWTDTTSHTAETARVVVASDGARIVAVTGECLTAEAADRAAVAACQLALGSLDPGVAPASRIALGLAAAADPAAADPAAAAPDPAGPAPVREAPSMSAPRGAGLDDGSITLPPTTVALDPPQPDRRPMYLGAGIVILAAMFWWNRKRRDHFEREDLQGPRERRPRRARLGARPRARDDDADDLHAAARGEAPDDQRDHP